MKMLKLSGAILVLMGGMWLFYAIPVRSSNAAAAESDARHFEAKLMIWAERHAAEGAVDEIFSDDGSLKLGGESEHGNFRQMIRETVSKSSVPVWPGLFEFISGLVILVTASRRQDRQAARAEPG